MKTKNFNDLIRQINAWGESNRFENESLVISEKVGEEDLSTLTASQWNFLKETLKSNGVYSIELIHENSGNFFETVNQFLSGCLKNTQIHELILSKSTLYDYTAPQWKIFFSETRVAGLKKIGFHFSDFFKIGVENCFCFLKELSASQIEQLDLSYSRFGEASERLCIEFFDKLAACPNIKHLMLEGNALGASNQFWNAYAQKIAKLNFTHLTLDSNRLFRVSESNWLNFCKGLQQSKINYLSLKNNCFYNFNVEQWKWFFQGMGATSITELDLKEHHSLKLKGDKWRDFCHGLKSTMIKTLHYENSQFTQEQKKIIEQILRENQEKMTFVSNEEQKTEMNFQFQLKVKTVLTDYNLAPETQHKHSSSKEKKDDRKVMLKNQKFELHKEKAKENETPVLKNYNLRKRTVQEENTKYITKKACKVKPK